jgi:hypothetical protein
MIFLPDRELTPLLNTTLVTACGPGSIGTRSGAIKVHSVPNCMTMNRIRKNWITSLIAFHLNQLSDDCPGDFENESRMRGRSQLAFCRNRLPLSSGEKKDQFLLSDAIQEGRRKLCRRTPVSRFCISLKGSFFAFKGLSTTAIDDCRKMRLTVVAVSVEANLQAITIHCCVIIKALFRGFIFREELRIDRAESR